MTNKKSQKSFIEGLNKAIDAAEFENRIVKGFDECDPKADEKAEATGTALAENLEDNMNPNKWW